jgi:hypothetical protein
MQMAGADYWAWAIVFQPETSTLVFTFQSAGHGEETFSLGNLPSAHVDELKSVFTLAGPDEDPFWTSSESSCEAALKSLPACVLVPPLFRARLDEALSNAKSNALRALAAKREKWDHVWHHSNLKQTLNRLRVLRDFPADHALVGKTVDNVYFELDRKDPGVWDYETFLVGVVPLEAGQVVQLRGLEIVQTWALPHLPLLCLSCYWSGATDGTLTISPEYPAVRQELDRLRDFFEERSMLANIAAMIDHRLLCFGDGTGSRSLVLTNEAGCMEVLFGGDQAAERSVCIFNGRRLPASIVFQIGNEEDKCTRVWATQQDPGLWLDDKKFLDASYQKRLISRLGI